MITHRDLRMLNLARQMSYMSDFPRVHVGCCVTLKNAVLSVGYNSKKSNPLQQRLNVYRHFKHPERSEGKEHAEISALSKMPWYVYENNFDLKKATIYVYREYRETHTYALSKPCPACMYAIKNIFKIGRIVFTIKDGIKEIKLK